MNDVTHDTYRASAPRLTSRRASRKAVSVCLVLSLVVATVALGSPCYYPEYYGVERVGTHDGRVIAEEVYYELEERYTRYDSRDGGLTWERSQGSNDGQVSWGGKEVFTADGKFSITGSEVVFTPAGGDPETVYSAEYLKQPVNMWVQHKRRGENERIGVVGLGGGRDFQAMVADPNTGNLVVALGLQGVAVHTSDGQWEPVSVGPYAPDDFSSLGRLQVLLSHLGFWTVFLSFPLAVTALAFVSIRMSSGFDLLLWIMCVFATLAAIAILFSVDSHTTDNFVTNVVGRVFLTLFIASAALPAAIAITEAQWNPFRGSIFASSFAMFAVVFLAFAAWVITGGPTLYFELSALVICGLIAISLVAVVRRKRQEARRLSS